MRRMPAERLRRLFSRHNLAEDEPFNSRDDRFGGNHRLNPGIDAAERLIALHVARNLRDDPGPITRRF